MTTDEAAGGKRLRVDIYASEDVIITTKEKDVELVPRYNQTECLIFLNDQGGGGEGPSLGSNVDGAIAVSLSIFTRPNQIQLLHFTCTPSKMLPAPVLSHSG